MVSNERDTTARASSSHGESSSRMSGTFGSLFRSRVDGSSSSSTRPNDRPLRPVSMLQQTTTARPPASTQQARPPIAAAYPQGSNAPTSSRPAQPYAQLPMRPGIPQSAPVSRPYYPAQQQQHAPYPQQHQFPNPHQTASAPANYHAFQAQQRPPYNYQQGPPQQQTMLPPTSAPYPSHGYTHAVATAAPPTANQGMSTSESSADLEAALLASKDTAEEDARKREAREREEAEHYAALHASEEQERARKLEEEEEAMLRQVLEASEREEREAQDRRQARAREEEEEQRLLLEESRQAALRDEEERLRRQHAELLARSKREAEEEEQRRREAGALQEAAEQEAVDQSLREMEDEWRRREDYERAMTAHVHQGGQLGSASYWQQLDQKKAYDLALRMDKHLTLGEGSSTSAHGAAQPQAGTSSRTASRPLPPTPGMAALQAGVERDMSTLRALDEKRRLASAPAEEDDEVWVPSDDEELLDTMGLRSTTNGQVEAADGEQEDDGADPFSDQAEAPPTYDEVREDRPPEAPTAIPEHIRFAPPPPVAASLTSDSSAIAIAEASRAEKSAAYTLEYGNASSSSTNTAIESAPTASQLRVLPSPPAERPRISTNLNPVQSSTTPTQASTSALPTPLSPVPSSASPSLAAASTMTDDTRPTRPTTLADSSRQASSATIATEFKQKAMKGTDFGYCSEPFSTALDLDDEPSKACFPNLIQLRKCNLDGRLRDAECFFVIRAPSWKAMLRALAWYGNTRIVAGPQEVVDHPRGVPMRIEVEFVTPSASPLSTRRGSDGTLAMTAYVSVCLSLALPSWADAESSALAGAIKKGSRALDAAYLRQGGTRRVIALPSQAPVLPMDMVRLAQHMHRAHIFSAACPSTSAKALHSPRDLHHAVERHDVGYVAKLQRRRRDAAARGAGDDAVTATLNAASLNGGGSNGVVDGFPVVSSIGRSERNRKNRMSALPSEDGADKENDASNDDDEDDDDEDDQGDILDAYAVEIVEGDDRDPSRMARMRARVKRKLAKRSGDPRNVDDDLQSWITPYDMTQHG